MFKAAFRCVLLPRLTLPTLAALPWLVFGSLLRIVYSIVLVYAYGISSFGRVYPIARGAALLLAGVLAVVVLAESLPLRGVAALLAVIAGIFLIARIDKRPMPDARALRAGLLAAALTASYTLVDARGVRVRPNAFGYAALGFIGESLRGRGGCAVATRVHNSRRCPGRSVELAGCRASPRD